MPELIQFSTSFESENARGDLFVFLGAGLPFRQTLGEIDHHFFAEQAGGRVDVEQLRESFRGVAGFFLEFARGGFEEGFVLFAVAGHELPHVLAGGVAVLPDEDDAPVGEHREDYHRAGVDDYFADGFDSVGLEDVVALEGEDATLE